ncbi:hypothetical protein GCM10022233_83850 [Streptomyces shaanxiensis]|uniref:Uncharacterized protein n=1 Tax=Streptomyces shaanxiensis TaxID=653357 RepID=A0ABP7WG90_9ACTN
MPAPEQMVLLGVGSAAMLAVGGTMPAVAASQGGETAASAQGASAKGVGATAWSCTPELALAVPYRGVLTAWSIAEATS